jgi:transcriptional regulator with XRE-family HTH domain
MSTVKNKKPKPKIVVDLPRKELAEFLGVSESFASHIRTGYKQVPPRDCQRVSERFNYPLHKLRPDIFTKPDPLSAEALTLFNRALWLADGNYHKLKKLLEKVVKTLK